MLTHRPEQCLGDRGQQPGSQRRDRPDRQIDRRVCRCEPQRPESALRAAWLGGGAPCRPVDHPLPVRTACASAVATTTAHSAELSTPSNCSTLVAT